MRIPAAALASLLAAPTAQFAPGPVQEEEALEERFYRAYYAENGLRDFEKAGSTPRCTSPPAPRAGRTSR
jgi:hypothetical protein